MFALYCFYPPFTAPFITLKVVLNVVTGLKSDTAFKQWF